MNEREIGEEKQNKEGGWETQYRLNNITTGIHSLCFWSWTNNRGSGETEQAPGPKGNTAPFTEGRNPEPLSDR